MRTGLGLSDAPEAPRKEPRRAWGSRYARSPAPPWNSGSGSRGAWGGPAWGRRLAVSSCLRRSREPRAAIDERRAASREPRSTSAGAASRDRRAPEPRALAGRPAKRPKLALRHVPARVMAQNKKGRPAALYGDFRGYFGFWVKIKGGLRRLFGVFRFCALLCAAAFDLTTYGLSPLL